MSDTAPYDVSFQQQIIPAHDLPEQRILQAVNWLLREHKIERGAGLSVVFTDDEHIRQLNREFRGIDAPTDVLSFSADLPPVIDADEAPYLGDLILALPYIERQAQAEQHPLGDELILAAVHGTLHLLGYDHDTPEHQAAMWQIQSRALHVVGIDIDVPLFEFEDGPNSSDSSAGPGAEEV